MKAEQTRQFVGAGITALLEMETPRSKAAGRHRTRKSLAGAAAGRARIKSPRSMVVPFGEVERQATAQAVSEIAECIQDDHGCLKRKEKVSFLLEAYMGCNYVRNVAFGALWRGVSYAMPA
ncbi:hypothetical protein [Aestuariivirga sp.]|uniref:hypothetical protein n=1 Tax=Aestuariivirga sp. TaxID=2650926 RepID=UPI0039E499A8